MTKKYVNDTGLGTFWNKAKEYIDNASAAGKLYYGLCNDVRGSTTKTVACDGFVMEEGACIAVQFAFGNTAPTFGVNVNNTGVGTILSPTVKTFPAGTTLLLYCEGLSYYVVGVVGDGIIASTSNYGLTKLYDGVDSTSTALAATANAVKTAAESTVGTSRLESGAVTAAKLDFTTFAAYGYTDSEITMSTTQQVVCTATVPTDGSYFIVGLVRANATETTSGVFNIWNQFQTSGSGAFITSKEFSISMSRNTSGAAGRASIPIMSVITSAAAEDTISLMSRKNTGAGNVDFAIIGLIRIA